MAATAGLAAVLVLMNLLDAAWLGFVAIALLVVAGLAVQLTTHGPRGFGIIVLGWVGLVLLVLLARSAFG